MSSGDDDDEYEEGEVNVELGFAEALESDDVAAIDEPCWSDWDGGKLGGRPVRLLVARPSLSLPPPWWRGPCRRT